MGEQGRGDGSAQGGADRAGSSWIGGGEPAGRAARPVPPVLKASAEQLRGAELPQQRFGGYARAEVDGMLDAAADTVESLLAAVKASQAEVAALQVSRAELEERLEQAQRRSPEEMIGEVLTTAHRAAEDVLEKARREAAWAASEARRETLPILAEAQKTLEDAGRLHREAEAASDDARRQASELLDAARAESTRLLAESSAEGERLRSEAATDAERVRAAAGAESERLRAEARADADRHRHDVASEAERRRAELEVENLRLETAIKGLRTEWAGRAAEALARLEGLSIGDEDETLEEGAPTPAPWASEQAAAGDGVELSSDGGYEPAEVPALEMEPGAGSDGYGNGANGDVPHAGASADVPHEAPSHDPASDDRELGEMFDPWSVGPASEAMPEPGEPDREPDVVREQRDGGEGEGVVDELHARLTPNDEDPYEVVKRPWG